MNISFLTKDQVWQEEKTNYWFNVDGEDWAISDNCGELTLLNADGCPVAPCDTEKKYCELYSNLCEKVELISAKGE